MKKWLICRHCGNLVSMVEDHGVPVVCCGEKMEVLEAQTQEGTGSEKHLPVVEIEGNKVTVTCGEVPHPMTPEHSIQWLYLETSKGGQRKKCSQVAQAVFYLAEDEKPLAAYAYCNLHGLWKKRIGF